MSTPIDYKSAGVDIELGNKLVDDYKKIVQSTHNPAVLNQLGGFNALYDLSNSNLKQPVLVSATDGVGTKLRLALNWQNHKGVGIDLVAMCVNDLIVIGAKPLFFLDYFAAGKLDKSITLEVVNSIAKGCQMADMALIGGETAEMPGIYQGKDYDLAGFCVGIVDKEKMVTGDSIQSGDSLIAIGSSGVHSNGYSLVRKILEQDPAFENQTIDDQPIKELLLKPTKIYSKVIGALYQENLMKAAAHITGGGLTENIPRFLPPNLSAHLDTQSWHLPTLFQWLQEKADLDNQSLRQTFNCGVGMVVCVAKENVSKAITLIEQHQETAWEIGTIVESPDKQKVVYSDES